MFQYFPLGGLQQALRVQKGAPKDSNLLSLNLSHSVPLGQARTSPYSRAGHLAFQEFRWLMNIHELLQSNSIKQFYYNSMQFQIIPNNSK